MQQKQWIIAAALGAGLATGLPIDAVAKPKESVSATVNGHKVKVHKPKQILASLIGGVLGFSITAGKATAAFHHTAKALVVTCVYGCAGPVFPADGQFCSVGYQEVKVAIHPTFKQWVGTSDGGVQVTIDSCDSTHISGTFQGTLNYFEPTASIGPVTVQDGKFDVLF
jgi:hypothetical protein